MSSAFLPVVPDSFEHYMTQIKTFELLTPEEELDLARRHRNHEDLDAAHRLICANLRFVVKIAYEYKAYGMKMLCARVKMRQTRCIVIKGKERFDAPLADTGITLRHIPATSFIEEYDRTGAGAHRAAHEVSGYGCCTYRTHTAPTEPRTK